MLLRENTIGLPSILLALYTNHWREERAARQRVDRDLAASGRTVFFRDGPL